jgi:hypothetical protein
MISISLPSSKPVDEVPETRTNRNNWNLACAIGYGLCDVMILAGVIHRSYKFRRNISVSADEAGGLGLFTGLVLLQIGQYLRVPETHFLLYLGVVFMDIPAILVIVTLLQGKAYGYFMLHPKKH